MLPLYDAHNHAHDAALAPHRAALAAEFATVGLARAVVNGTCEADWPAVAALATAHAWVLPSYGLHPWDCGHRSPAWLATLRARLEGDPAAAVGEAGLDRWMLDRARPDDPRLAGLRRAPLAEQAEVCAAQLALAAALGRPATLHCLEAFGALHDLLRHAPPPARGFLLHAYSGPAELVRPFADLGAYFSFNGAFLAPRHAARRAVFQLIPAARLLVETDAPAMRLPPAHEAFPPLAVPDGSLANHPANLAATLTALAHLRRVPPDDLRRQIGQNFTRLFLTPAPTAMPAAP